MIKLNGGQVVVKMLEEFGVEFSFGMAGFQHLPYYNALAHSKKIRHILIRDERSGAFIADAFARVSNKVAVCDATVGPGATNLISGLAESFYASIPVIALTSDVNDNYTNRGANQECDQLAIFAPVCKESIHINKINRIPELMRKAFNVAISGRPGPVHVNIPENIFHGVYEFEEEELVVDLPNYFPAMRYAPEEEQLEKAAQLLMNAQNPVIVSGGGSLNSEAYDEVKQLVELLQIPIATTISGKGIIEETHPLNIHILGRYTRIANNFVKEADVLLVIGCRLGEMATSRWSLIQPQTKIIHVDIDPYKIGKNYKTAVSLPGDVKSTLRNLIKMLKPKLNPTFQRPGIKQEIQLAKEAWLQSVSENINSNEIPINIAFMLNKLRKVVPEDTIMVADGGFSAHWSSVYWDIMQSGRHYLANRGQAAIGYGLPAAIGAKLAEPNKTVVALSGDGGLGLSIMELETAVRAKTPVIIIVVNNNALGYIKALQHAVYGGDYISVDLTDISYAEIAKNCGCYGARITNPEQLEPEFKNALTRTIPTVLEVMVTTDPAKMLPGKDDRTKQ